MKRAPSSFVLAVALCASACASSNDTGDTDVDAGEPPPVDAAPASGDGFPRGAISFFLGSLCPTGWAPYADAVGRTIVPVAAADDAGAMVGTPLAVNEARAHRHDIAVRVSLPSVSYAGIAGEANHGVARSGPIDGIAATADATPDVPYAQLRVCRKTAEAPEGRAAPSGVIAFFAGACPPSWNPAPSSLVGRYLVALPPGGTAGRTFGGEPLTAGELRAHTHDVTGSVAAPSHGIALAGGCCAGGYGGAGTHAATITAGPAPVEVPYVQLAACLAP